MGDDEETGFLNLGTVADRTVLSPAERALLVEQAESMKVELDSFIEQCKDGTAGDAIRRYIPVVTSHNYITSVMGTKITQTIHRDHEEGSHG